MIPKFDSNYNSLMSRHFDSLGVLSDVIEDLNFKIFKKMLGLNEPEYNYMYWYHKDHLGSSTQITDRNETVIHHIEYMPSGEQFSEQRDIWATPYKFNGKELDAETNLYYYGARYYAAMENIWLSVDPLSDKYPHQSPFMFCSGNPVMRVDMDGMEDDWVEVGGKILYDSRVTSQKTAEDLYGNTANHIENGTTINVGKVSVQFKENGIFSLNGIERWATNEATGLPGAFAPFYPSSGRCDYAPINIEDLIGGAIAVKLLYKQAVNQFAKYTAKGVVNYSNVLNSASSAHKGSTVLGHALSKHAGRKPGIWGKLTGNPSTWHSQALKHFDDIMNASGSFTKTTTEKGIKFLEKRLPDGRGIRLNMDGTFKGFID
jgi:RHS repeat-associated protein